MARAIRIADFVPSPPMPNDAPSLDSPLKQRRLFVVRALNDSTWMVTAEGSTEEHQFANRGLAVGYAGLWASANAPSQLIECRADGTLGTLKEFD